MRPTHVGAKSPFHRMIDLLRIRWSTFNYNYSWPQYVWLLDSWLAKLTIVVPVLGYLILFNDGIAQHLTFDLLSGRHNEWGILSPQWRLRFLYFGTMLLGLANLGYLIRRPYVMKLGKSSFEYVRNLLEHATLSDYVQMHEAIRLSPQGHYTLHGKYYDSDWDAFVAAVKGQRPDFGEDKESTGNWVLSKNKFESLLRDILIETYVRSTVRRRFSLTLCILIGIAGLFLLLVPSADLFVRVLGVIFNAQPE